MSVDIKRDKLVAADYKARDAVVDDGCRKGDAYDAWLKTGGALAAHDLEQQRCRHEH